MVVPLESQAATPSLTSTNCANPFPETVFPGSDVGVEVVGSIGAVEVGGGMSVDGTVDVVGEKLVDGAVDVVELGLSEGTRIDVSIEASTVWQLDPWHSWRVTTTSGTSWYSCSSGIS